PFSLLNWGQNYVTSGFAGVTMALVPLFALPLAHFTLQSERMTVIKTIGFLIGFIGIVVLIEPARFLASTGAALEPLARMACITAALCYALGTINTRLCPPVSTLVYSAGGLLLGFFIILPISLWVDGLPQMGSPNAIFALLYLGIFPTAIATLLLVWVVRTAGPTFLTLVNYQVPIWAVILGVIFFAEVVPPSFILALGLILVGLAVSQIRLRKT
ncbi:MAG: EamA family transporter, partial [Pseudomonadota bacterium]